MWNKWITLRWGKEIDCMGIVGQKTREFENQERMRRGNGVEG